MFEQGTRPDLDLKFTDHQQPETSPEQGFILSPSQRIQIAAECQKRKKKVQSLRKMKPSNPGEAQSGVPASRFSGTIDVWDRVTVC